MDKFVIRKRKDNPNTNSSNTTHASTANNTNKSDVQEPPTKMFKTSDSSKFFSQLEDCLKVPIGDLHKEEDFEHHFEKMAAFLLNEVVLKASSQLFRLVEIEFYFTSPSHPDPFTHQHSIQIFPNWYFHRQGKSSMYRDASRKGLDISIGVNQQNLGGILIRSIEKLGSGPKGEYQKKKNLILGFHNKHKNNKRLTCGPSKTVDMLLSCCSASSIPDLVENKLSKNLNCVDKASQLSLELVSEHKNLTLKQRDVHKSSRVGLALTKGAKQVEPMKTYIFKPYRFFTNPKEIFKGKVHMVLQMWQSKPSHISSVLGPNVTTITKILQNMEKGRTFRIDKFIGTKLENDEEIANCFGCILQLQQQKTIKETSISSTKSNTEDNSESSKNE